MAVAVTLYETEIGVLLSLPEEQRGRILTAILCDTTGKELPEMDASDTAIFTLVNAQVKRAAELSSKRKQSAKSRWQNQANGDNYDTQEEQDDTTPMQDNNTDMQIDTSGMQNQANGMQNNTSDEICSDLHNANLCTITNTNTITKTNTNTLTNTSTSEGGGFAPAVAPASTKKAKAQKKSPDKIKYADFVSLTQQEYDTLVAEYGEEAVKWFINKLNIYKGSTGKTYKSDYLAIRNWVIECYEEEQTKRRQQPNNKPPGANGEQHSKNPFVNAIIGNGE